MSALYQIQPHRPLLPCVLFVDDEASNRQAFQSMFRRDFKVIVAADLQEAWSELERHAVHVVIADQRMPGMTGSELLHLVRERHPHVRRMLMTGYSDLQAVIDAVNLGGVSQYIAKPWDPVRVIDAVQRAFADLQREQDKDAYTAQLIETNRQLEFALRQALLS